MPPRNDAGGSNLPRSASASAAYSIYPTDSVQDTAEALGLPPLRDGVASALAADVEYRLRQLVQDASKFMRHGKRSQLRVCDVDRALRQRNVDPIFGFHPTTLGKASASGHYPTPVGSTFRRIQTQSGPIHLVADEEIDLEKALEGGPQVALGPGVGWSAHWLAVEGVQPAVPQNPVPGYSGTVGVASGTATPSNVLATAGNSMVQPGGTSAFLAQPGAGRPGQAVAKPLIKHVLSRELQLYFERLTNAIVNPPSEADVNESGEGANSANKHASGDGDTSMADGLDAAAAREPNGQPVLKRSEREKAKTSGNIVRDAALASLRGDPGLHQLVPYLIQWVGERIQHGLRDEVVLDQMLYTIEALVFNPYLGIEPYLHQLLPFVLSILLTASLGQSAASTRPYALRVQAGAVLASIVSQYSATYPTLKPRIVRTMIGALDAGCARAVHAAAGGQGTRADVGDDDEMRDGADDEGDQHAQRARAETPSVFGPRESASTKLGAVVGLRALGHGPVRALLVREARREDCLLRRLGYWCAEVERFAARHEQVQAIVDDVRAAFADIASPPAATAAATAATAADADAVPSTTHDTLHDAAVAERIGAFWVERLSSHADAARGVLLALSEVQHNEHVRSQNGTATAGDIEAPVATVTSPSTSGT